MKAAPLLLSTPDGTHIAWDGNGDRLGEFYADADNPGYWRVTLPSGLKYDVLGPKTPEGVAATLAPS